MKKEMEILYARKLPVVIDPFVFHPLSESRMLFKNRSTAWEMDILPKTDPKWHEVREQLKQYNAYQKVLEETPGFEQFFIDNGCCVSRKQVADSFGEDFAKAVFDMPEFLFQTDLSIKDDFLMEREYAPRYQIEVPEFGEVHFEAGDICGVISTNMNIHNILLWSWSDDDRDLTYSLYDHFELVGLIDHENEHKNYDSYDCYDQHRDNMAEPDKNLQRCLEVLESTGYLVRYKIRPKKDTPWFIFQREGAYGVVATLDRRFKQDPLLMAKLQLILTQPEDKVYGFRYFLTDRNGKQYLSDKPGKLGGHRKLKIYGKLDCTSANRHITNGDYIRHRVFFADEETAIAAGYRPCGVCMKEEYQEWKVRHPD